MTGFFGRFEYQMDEKGRVSLPSSFRKGAEGGRLVLLQWEKPYLTLFPEPEWVERQRELLELRRSGTDAARYVRHLLSMATDVVPDKQGRILVPGWLQEAAHLEGSVLFIGNIDHVELWDPDSYRTSHEGAVSDAMASFAKRILG